MLAAFNRQRRVAVVTVFGIVHIVAHQQALVSLVLYAVDVLGHLLQTYQRHGVQTVQRLAGYLIVTQVLVNLRFLSHTQVEVVFLFVLYGVAVGYVFVFGVELLKLPVFLGAGTNHVERAVLRAQEVPSMQVITKAIAVRIATVLLLTGIRPQRFLYTDGCRVDARVNDANNNMSRRL